LIQKKNTLPAKTIQGVLDAQLKTASYDCILVAMAYVSIAGVRTLLDSFSSRQVMRSRWLVGLDDYVTQPGAIELLLKLDRSQVRVASLKASSLRFHPKVCRFHSSSGTGTELLMVGSANLTSSALAGNSESVVFLEGNNRADKSMFKHIWTELWSQGHVPSPKELADYKKKYDALKNDRKMSKALSGRQGKPKRSKSETILESDNAEIDPSQASTCWIECGFITAMGRELEFKAEQGLFFGLEPSGEKDRRFRFHVSNGQFVKLRMKYQQNHMWRLQMNNEVPEVKTGLRPTNSAGKLGRSNKVAVFTRTADKNTFNLRFLDLGSRQFSNLKNKSKLFGTMGRTAARYYGWC
jgi:HKD family nuclease